MVNKSRILPVKSKTKQTVDFKRTKAKVGKKITKNANVTDLSFKSKRINMPLQTLGAETGELLSQRNLTIKAILGQLNHYNEKVRRDAVGEMKDIITRHVVLVKLHLGDIVEGVVKLTVDADPAVRRAYLTLMPVLFSLADPFAMTPFIRLFVVYICSGMTNLDDGIRTHSLKALNALVDGFPTLVSPFAPQILSNFVDLLSAKRQSTSAALGGTSMPASSELAPATTTGANLSKGAKTIQIKEQTVRSSSVLYRVHVLRSLHHFLAAAAGGAQSPSTSSTSSSSSSSSPLAGPCARPQSRQLTWTTPRSHSHPLPNPHGSVNATELTESPRDANNTTNYHGSLLLLHRPMHSAVAAATVGSAAPPTTPGGGFLGGAGGGGGLSSFPAATDALVASLPHVLDLWLETRGGAGAAGARAGAGGRGIKLEVEPGRVEELQTLVEVVGLMVGEVVRGHAGTGLYPASHGVWAVCRALQGHMLQTFPLRGGSEATERSQALIELNLSLVRLLSLFIRLLPPPPSRMSRSRARALARASAAAAAAAAAASGTSSGEMEVEGGRGETEEEPGLSEEQTELLNAGVDYLEWVLEKSTLTPTGSGAGAGSGAPGSEAGSSGPEPLLTGSAVDPMMVTLRAVLPVVGLAPRDRLLAAFTSFFTCSHWKSRAKRACVAFIATSLTSIRPPCTTGGVMGGGGGGGGPAGGVDPQVAVSWLGGFPELLWRFGGTFPEATHMALTALNAVARQAPSAVEAGDEESGGESGAEPAAHVAAGLLTSISSSIAPFFYTSMPASSSTGGKKRKLAAVTGSVETGPAAAAAAAAGGGAAAKPEKAGVRHVFGPFLSLPEPTQLLALSLLYNLPRLSSRLLRALALCVSSPQLGPRPRAQVFALLQRRAGTPPSPTSVITFLTTALVASTSAHPSVAPLAAVSGQQQQQQQVMISDDSFLDLTAVCCQQLGVLNLGLGLTDAVLPTLQQHLVADLPNASESPGATLGGGDPAAASAADAATATASAAAPASAVTRTRLMGAMLSIALQCFRSVEGLTNGNDGDDGPDPDVEAVSEKLRPLVIPSLIHLLLETSSPSPGDGASTATAGAISMRVGLVAAFPSTLFGHLLGGLESVLWEAATATTTKSGESGNAWNLCGASLRVLLVLFQSMRLRPRVIAAHQTSSSSGAGAGSFDLQVLVRRVKEKFEGSMLDTLATQFVAEVDLMLGAEGEEQKEG